MGETIVAFDPRVAKRSILVPTKSEYRLVHLLGIEHLEADEKMEVLHCQANNRGSR